MVVNCTNHFHGSLRDRFNVKLSYRQRKEKVTILPMHWYQFSAGVKIRQCELTFSYLVRGIVM